eukprot:gene5865-9693_t
MSTEEEIFEKEEKKTVKIESKEDLLKQQKNVLQLFMDAKITTEEENETLTSIIGSIANTGHI